MSRTSVRPSRVDFWPADHQGAHQRIGRVESLSTTRCTILTHANPDPGTLMELRIHLGDTDWPLRVARARVLWGHGDAFTVELLGLSAGDAGRLRTYLTRSPFPASYRGRSLVAMSDRLKRLA